MVFALAASSAVSVCAGSGVLFPVVVNDRWGFVDKSGKLVANPQFERASAFAEGFAAVRLGHWGYADSSGGIVVVVGARLRSGHLTASRLVPRLRHGD